MAILRNQRGQLVQIRVAERLVRRDKLAREILVDAADDDAFVYRVPEDLARMHRLWRAGSGAPVPVPARILAAFVGSASGIPLIYDGRTGYAERTVDVARDATGLDALKVRELLKAGGIPLTDGILAGGRSVLFWMSPHDAEVHPEQPAESPPNFLAPGWQRSNPDSTLGLRGRAISIDAGGIPIAEFLRFLSDLLGRPLFVSPGVAAVESVEIDTVSPIEGADAEVVNALLRANGISVRERTLHGSGDVLVATLARAR